MRMSEALRIWQWFSLFLVLALTASSMAIYAMFPLKKTEIRYVEFLASEDVYFRVAPSSEINQSQRQLYFRQAVRKYVNDRNTKDDMTGKERVKIIRSMSSKAVWEEFKVQFTEMTERMEDVTRKVEIISDSPIGQSPIHQVEFRTTDTKR